MFLTSLGAVHFTAAIMALVMGLSVFPAAKGTPFHRAIGAGYVLAMLVVNVTALNLYRLTGQFNVFHVLAFVSLTSVAAGLWPLVTRKEGWLPNHLARMTGSYFGLLAAAAAEAVSRIPTLRPYFSSPEKIFAISLALTVVFVGLAIVLNRRMILTYAKPA